MKLYIAGPMTGLYISPDKSRFHGVWFVFSVGEWQDTPKGLQREVERLNKLRDGRVYFVGEAPRRPIDMEGQAR